MKDKKVLNDNELENVSGGTERPNVSIIVPTYNVEEWLPEILDKLHNR